MGFADDLRAFSARTETKVDVAFDQLVDAAFESVVHGSLVTGAPGQPVSPEHGGKLRDSWTVDRVSPNEAVISTDLDYATDVEDGIDATGPFVLKSDVGGLHSVKLTVAGIQPLADQVAVRVAEGAGI